jgi:hypothetical protein
MISWSAIKAHQVYIDHKVVFIPWVINEMLAKNE